MPTDWHNFLTGQGAQFDSDNLVHFADSGQAVISGDTISVLADLSILEISGQDAATFLNGQFTTDVTQLQEGDKQLSAWCNPKGRVISIFYLYRHNDNYFLLLPAQLKDAFSQRLQMYVLRAAVTIEDRSAQLISLGIRSKDADIDGCLKQHMYFTINDQDKQRVIVIGSPREMQDIWTTSASCLTPVSTHYWQLFNHMAGITWIDAQTSESYLPQELNLDLIDGLDFKKGCYPGQEIVARVHYRGQVKKRTMLADLSTDPAPEVNTKLYVANEQHSIGTILSINKRADEQYSVLCVINLNQINAEEIRLTAKDGPVLRLRHLPYSL